MANALPFDKAVEACEARGMTMFAGLFHEENEVVVKGLLSVGHTVTDEIWMADTKLNPFVTKKPTGIIFFK